MPASPAVVAGQAQGIYRGTVSDGREFYVIVLENDQFYALYGNTASTAFQVAGFLQGDATSGSGSFNSADAVDVTALGTRAAATVNASYVPGVSLTGSLTEPAGTVSFTSAPIAPGVIDYNSPANLADIRGTWNMTSLRGYSSTLTISTTGDLTATSEGCSFSGTFTPRASGKNVFDVAITFGPAPCKLPGESIRGIAIDYLLTNGQRQLIVAGIDAARTGTAAFFGVR